MSKIVETIETAVDVIERLQNAGHQAVFAGGCVRDFLLGIEPKDIDIATSATPEQVEALFDKTVAVGKSFGVIRVLIDEEEFEVATFRKDSKESDGRRPDSVEFSSMEEDAKRRDLTINALFFDPIADKIYDFVGGQEDIKARNIRFVGVPEERIEEDKLRLLRVIRFAARGGWVLNRATADAVVKNAHKVTSVSAERIVDELTKIFCHQFPDGYSKLNDMGLWKHIFPDVDHESDVWHMLKRAGKDLVDNKALAWACVLTRAVNPIDFMQRNKFDGATMDEVMDLLILASKFRDCRALKGSERMRLIANKYFANHILFAYALANGVAADYLLDVQASTPKGQIHPEKLVDGNDLIAMGVQPGKQIKAILQLVADEQREGRITTREQGLVKAKEFVVNNIS